MTPSQFYRSREWERFRHILMQERTDPEVGAPICAHCGRPIVKPYDCIGHHKTELTADNVEDASIALNPENVELVHHKCHNEIHERYSGNRREVFLVFGAPYAGKSSWVQTVARPDDLLVDLDRIWGAICYGSQDKPERLLRNMFGVRDVLIDQIRTRTGQWRSAYLVGGYPIRSERERLAELLGAQLVHIDTPEAECMQRAQTEKARGYVRDWFETYNATRETSNNTPPGPA